MRGSHLRSAIGTGLAIAVVVAAAAVAAAAIAAMPALADDVEVGRADVVDPSGGASDGGGSATPFTLDLPEGASCPGDSADDGYRVNSYMVPEAVAPTAVTYDGLGPTPKVHGRYDGFRQPLFDLATSWYVSALTADAESPGEPGLILHLPSFSFGVYRPGDVPPGTYRIGVACTLLNEITRVWDARIEVVDDVEDQPAGIRWRPVDEAGAESGGRDGHVAAPLAVALVVAGGGTYLVTRRRRPPPVPTTSREEP